MLPGVSLPTKNVSSNQCPQNIGLWGVTLHEPCIVLHGAQKRIQFFSVAWGLSLFNGLYLHGIRGGPFFREHHSIIQALILIEFAFIFVEGDFFLSSSLKQLLLILIMFLLVPDEYKYFAADVNPSNYVSSDFFADGFLEYLPSGSRTTGQLE